MVEPDPRPSRVPSQPVEEGISGTTWLIILVVLALLVAALWWMPPGLARALSGIFRLLSLFK